jgi:hypothetical protein
MPIVPAKKQCRGSLSDGIEMLVSGPCTPFCQSLPAKTQFTLKRIEKLGRQVGQARCQ